MQRSISYLFLSLVLCLASQAISAPKITPGFTSRTSNGKLSPSNQRRSSMSEQKDILVLELNIGKVVIELRPDIAPKHVEQIKTLVNDKAYDGIVFHRVIEGFVAQGGDVEYGHHDNLNENLVGTGGSKLPNIPAEFSAVSHKRGIVSMARSQDPNSANSQFYICLADVPFLDRQYSVFGNVIEGMDVVDRIKKGHPQSGRVDDPDYIVKAYLQ